MYFMVRVSAHVSDPSSSLFIEQDWRWLIKLYEGQSKNSGNLSIKFFSRNS
jgi:hypothetical protein